MTPEKNRIPMAYTTRAPSCQQKKRCMLSRPSSSRIVVLLVMASTLAGCAPTRAVRGDLLQDYQLAAVQIGSDTQADVAKELGSPTTVAPFDDKVWYYIGQDTEKHGPLDPKILKERIIRVSFNAQGVATEVKDITQERAEIPYSRDKTPTSGNEITLPQQLLGNLGKFNNADKGASAPIGSDQGGTNGR